MVKSQQNPRLDVHIRASDDHWRWHQHRSSRVQRLEIVLHFFVGEISHERARRHWHGSPSGRNAQHKDAREECNAAHLCSDLTRQDCRAGAQIWDLNAHTTESVPALERYSDLIFTMPCLTSCSVYVHTTFFLFEMNKDECTGSHTMFISRGTAKPLKFHRGRNGHPWCENKHQT